MNWTIALKYMFIVFLEMQVETSIYIQFINWSGRSYFKRHASLLDTHIANRLVTEGERFRLFNAPRH